MRKAISLFCTSCHALQEPISDYYALLGLERKLAIAPDKLQQQFYEMSRHLHPDLFTRKPEREKGIRARSFVHA